MFGGIVAIELREAGAMIRRSLVVLSKASKGRTVVRDPRKAKARKSALVEAPNHLPTEQNNDNSNNQPLPFQPSHQNQQSVGSTLASYSLAGAGVAMGVTLVGAIFGGF